MLNYSLVETHLWSSLHHHHPSPPFSNRFKNFTVGVRQCVLKASSDLRLTIRWPGVETGYNLDSLEKIALLLSSTKQTWTSPRWKAFSTFAWFQAALYHLLSEAFQHHSNSCNLLQCRGLLTLCRFVLMSTKPSLPELGTLGSLQHRVTLVWRDNHAEGAEPFWVRDYIRSQLFSADDQQLVQLYLEPGYGSFNPVFLVHVFAYI